MDCRHTTACLVALKDIGEGNPSMGRGLHQYYIRLLTLCKKWLKVRMYTGLGRDK